MSAISSRSPRLSAILLAAALSCAMAPALARDDRCRRDQDCAREALVHGEIRPLSDVLGVVRDKVPGDIIEIELDREDGIWVYEVKVLPPSGRRKKLEIDARTLEILKIK
ncbi:PepSY domain-containing protein [Pigmentiphaga sp. GD03639]|uniref:PepSY domain-containing protein n=1 Tax=Pigmentiphaga daeguensis TaxID=414049 RepID=A0ABN1CJR0_9BURK|nr:MULTISPECIES: PepSY domain-containing protein [unclassified Pigmentiphaga]MDH2238118.1 PepSY domain-containing protein [Pigmentiphaga sp. GD03639]OVZ66072.1 peptidase M4 [Pigmentiphaga sp. NML030171]